MKQFSETKVPLEFKGNSFILNARDLFKASYYDSEKIDYIALCSLRNYFDFEYSKEAGLYIYFSPISKEKLLKNRLLTINNDFIKFKYEEK